MWHHLFPSKPLATSTTHSLNLSIYFYKRVCFFFYKLWILYYWNYITQCNRNIFRGTTLFRHKCCFHCLSLVSISISIWYSLGVTRRWFGLSIGGIWTRLCRLPEIWHHHSHCPRKPRHGHGPHTSAPPQSLPIRTRPCALLVVMPINILDWCYRIATSKSEQFGPWRQHYSSVSDVPAKLGFSFVADQAGLSRAQWSIFQISRKILKRCFTRIKPHYTYGVKMCALII